MNSIITFEHVKKQYKNGKTALDEISFTVESGVFGLLGANGAGKTTLMKLLATILRPTSGSISVCGYDTIKQGNAVRRLIGYLPQELTMYPTLTVFDFVSYMASLKGVRDKKRIMNVLEEVDMAQFSNQKIGRLSGGMKRRVGIAQALVGDPQILIVDEPTAGLDPEERVRFQGVLSRFAKDGKCVLLSTHIVEDVYRICERLAVLRNGRLFFYGDTEKLVAGISGKVKVVELQDEQDLIPLRKKAVVLSTVYESGIIRARIMDEQGLIPVPAVTETLEDAYLYYMGGKGYE